MRGARRLRPVRPTAVPSWDLSVVLEGLVTVPFEPLESASDRILTLKVVFLLALTSLKRVGDLQAFSVSETCMDFAPGLVKVTLQPRPGYIPRSCPRRSDLKWSHFILSIPLPLLQVRMRDCPVRALKLYVDRSKVWRKSPQLLICFGAGRRGLATSKQRISHWVRDAISLAYKLLTLPTGFFSAEKSEEWMARSPVWPDDVIASETASRHQPMNWRDSIWVSDSVTRWAFPMRKAKLRSVSFPIQRTRVTRITRDVFLT